MQFDYNKHTYAVAAAGYWNLKEMNEKEKTTTVKSYEFNGYNANIQKS